MKGNDQLATLVLAAVILVSVLFSSLPLVHASYEVGHASFPPDLPADVTYDGKVDVRDAALVAKAYGSWFPDHGLWNARFDVNDDGKVDVKDVGAVAKLFGKIYDTSATPIAYSTSFEFDVPDTSVSGVWYYILARIYMPSWFLSNACFLSGSCYEVQHVVIDTIITGSTGYGSFNISLGNLTQGYHLLELTYLAPANGGSINFTVRTSANEAAWLDRFRVCIPYYNDLEYGYIVKTNTTFSEEDDYFLGGYADEYISSVHTDGLIWNDWMWNLSSTETINAWGDGFLYPLGHRLPSYNPSVSFTFGNENSGLLDFYIISWTFQRGKIGTPKYYALTNASLIKMTEKYTGCYIWGVVENAVASSGSKWDGTAGESARFFENRLRINCNFTVDSYSGRGGFEIGLGVGWAKPAIPNALSDMGITVNFTCTNYTSDLLLSYFDWWELHLDSYSIDIYSFSGLDLNGVEFTGAQNVESIVNPDWTVALDYAGTVEMFVSSLMGQPEGATVGLQSKG